MKITDIAELLLTNRGPRDAAQRTLSWLQEEQGARSAALWLADGDELTLQLGVGTDQESIDGALALWVRQRAALAAGQPASEGRSILIATRPEGFHLYLDGVDTRRLDIASAVDCAAVAAKVLRRTATGFAGGEHVKADGLRREELIATLRLHEWNSARVARVKGVTRKTIYDWLEKFQIPRERVSKS